MTPPATPGPWPTRRCRGRRRTAARQAVQHRRPREERHRLRRQPGKQLRPQVVRHEPVSPTEPDPFGAGCAPRLERQRGQVQPDRPSLGPPDERGRLRLGEPHPRPLQQLVRLTLVHRQLLDPDLHDATQGAQPTHRERRPDSGGQHQLRPRHWARRELHRERGHHVQARRPSSDSRLSRTRTTGPDITSSAAASRRTTVIGSAPGEARAWTISGSIASTRSSATAT